MSIAKQFMSSETISMKSESEIYPYVLRVVRRMRERQSKKRSPAAATSGTAVEPCMDQSDQQAKQIARRLLGGSRPNHADVNQYDLNTRLPGGMLTRHLSTQSS
jgi:hypothetical protein